MDMATFRTRGYLPHLENENSTYFVTFRLAGSLPRSVLDAWEFERKDIEDTAKAQKRPLSHYERKRLRDLYSQKVDKYLDRGEGNCWLQNPRIAELVVSALKHFDTIR